jgi:hypothetical protein
MPNISGTLGGFTLPTFAIPFIEKPLENAGDVLTLDGTLYSDFVNQRREWEINFKVLSESDYDDLRAVYDTMFSTGTYPTFICSYYSINTPVRMRLNDKDIRFDGGCIYDVSITLTQEAGF